MLVERSELLINEGQEAAFAAAMAERGLPLLANVPGVVSIKLGRGVENPGKFILLVEWIAMEAHTAFRTLPVYPEFSKVLRPFVKSGAMEHFDIH